MPSITIGVDAKMPKALAPLSRKRHFTFSCETVWESIGDCVVARVFARSWLCAGHEPALAAHSGGGCPTAGAGSAADDDVPTPLTAPIARTCAGDGHGDCRDRAGE